MIRFTKPSNELFMGCLFPQEASESDENKEITTDTEDNDDETTTSQSSQSSVLPTSTKPFSLSVSFLTMPKGSVQVSPKCKIYYRVVPALGDYLAALANQYGRPDEAFDLDAFLKKGHTGLKIEHPEVWKRVEVNFDAITFDLSSPAIAALDRDDFVLPTGQLYVERPPINIESLQGGQQSIDSFWGKTTTDTPLWKADLRINDFGPVPGESDEYHMFTVTFINSTEKPEYEKRNVFETAFFDCHLTLDLGDINIVPVSQKWDYELPYSSEVTGDAPPNAFEVRYPVYVWGNGCFPEFVREENRIITNVLNTAETSRTDPLDSKNFPEGVDLLFTGLQKDPINSLGRLLKYLKTCHQQYLRISGGKKAENDTKQFEVVMKRFEAGVERLKKDPLALRAFGLMNKVYSSAYGANGNWRLFQLVFIVGNIEAICLKAKGGSETQDENAEILFVSTGGGKTEAYVGLTTFLIFYQRLIGQLFGIGTWVKFPLRLLALDQFDRLLKTTIWAEKIRRDESIGGDPFSLGFFVGNSPQFPGTVAEWVLEKMEKPGNPSAGWKPTVFSRKNKDTEAEGALLGECPICRANKDNAGDYRWTYLPKEHRVKHWCEDCKTEFFVYITDEEVYRYLPSILISTVDKLAVGAWRPPMAGLLGATVYKCKDHGFSITPKECSIMSPRCGNTSSEIFHVDEEAYWKFTGPFEKQGIFSHCGCTKPIMQELKTHSHAPVLIVQDELHLLHENLGTTDSYFETLVDWIIKENSKRFPKHICMSATLAGARKQVGLLYLRGVNLWPGDAPSEYPLKTPAHDAFFKHEEDIHRIYVGIMPHGKTPDFASYRCLQYAWCRIQAYLGDPTLTRSVTGAAPTIPDEEVKAFIRDFYRKSFVYQGRKIGTHNFASSIDRIVNPDIKRYDPSYRPIVSESVTGDNSMDEIRTIRERVEKKGDLDCLISTSLISHGVDMTNVNLMFFQGMPDMTSEFIQASSRVGRKYPGIIFISFYPSRSRDVELASSFRMYVETMRYWVESVAISRWCEQALREIFVTATCFILTTHGQQILGGPGKSSKGAWPLTIHQLGDPSKQYGFLRWRALNGVSLDNDVKNILLNGLGFSEASQRIVPKDLLPTPFVLSEMNEQLIRMYSEFTTTLTRKVTASTPAKYKDGQIARFCKDILGSPQDKDGSANSEFEDRWFQCMTGLRGIQVPVQIRLSAGSAKYLGEELK